MKTTEQDTPQKEMRLEKEEEMGEAGDKWENGRDCRKEKT